MKQHKFRRKRSHLERKVARKQGQLKEKVLFSGHHHTFCHSTLGWTDSFGVPLRLDVNLSGMMHERRLYNDSKP